MQPADVLQAEQDVTPVKHKEAEGADTFQDFKVKSATCLSKLTRLNRTSLAKMR